MGPFRPFSWNATAGLLVVSAIAVAQPLPEENLEVEREVMVTGKPERQPVVVYGAANISLQLVFEAPLQRTDAGTALVVLPGADVRLHPYLDNSLFLTPSMALAHETAVPLHVALVDGGVPLLLAFQPGRVDHVLRILQRPPVPEVGATASRVALQEALSLTARTVFKDEACASLQSPLVRVRKVVQAHANEGTRALVCAAGMINYLRVPRMTPGCAVSSARLSRPGKDAEVLLLEPAQPEKEKGVNWLVLATWSLPEEADLALTLLTADGTACERQVVKLGPGETP